MSRTLSASDRASLIRLASSLPVGSPERKAILAGLSKRSADLPSEGLRVRALGVTRKGLKDGVIYTLKRNIKPFGPQGQDTYTFLLRGKGVAVFAEEAVSEWLEQGAMGDADGLKVV
jgi:hypothetical protein